jgi:hypothetical protein
MFAVSGMHEERGVSNVGAEMYAAVDIYLHHSVLGIT